LSEGWLHDPSAIPQTLLWGLGAVFTWWLGGFIGKRLGRRLLARSVTVMPFVVVLYFFYENLARLTPTNL